MALYEIDPERTTFEVRVRPGLPMPVARVTGLTGSFEVTLDDEGEVDLRHPIVGNFAMQMDDLNMGNPVMTMAAKRFLAGDDGLAITGGIDGIEPHPAGYQLGMTMTFRGGTHRMDAVGAMDRVGEEMLVTGRTRVNPRDIGVRLPPMVKLAMIADWKIALTPT